MVSYEPGQNIQVRWQGQLWVPAVVSRVYSKGLDATVGVRGVNYFLFQDVRPSEA